MEDSPPLTGLRVIDLADPSGMFAGRLLAMLGADVVTTEPGAGHPLRGGAFFWFYAAGKRSVTIDPNEAGSRLLERLAQAADVAIVTGPHASPASGHPGQIVASISPFGEHGSYARWQSCDLVAQAMGGMLAANGLPDGPPLPALGLQSYHQAGIAAAIGILAALLARERSGRGQRVDVSLQAAVAAGLEHVPARFFEDGTITRRSGALHWGRFFRTGPARDGWGLYTTYGDWTTLVEWMKADGMAGDLDDPVYEEASVRQVRAEHVFDVIDAWARRYDAGDLVAQAQLRRLAFASVRPPEALFADPQLVARRFFVPARHPGHDRNVAFPGPPFRLGALPSRFARLASAGEDQDAVLREWLGTPGRAAAAPEARPQLAAATGIVRPLAGVRVLDFTWLVAGPIATRVLADLGAEVIKIEHPRAPDVGDRRGGMNGNLGRGKRSVVLDLATDEGRRLARRLAAASDVVIDNFSARVMDTWGLDPASLRSAKPDLIVVRMTGFGLTGPDRDHVSFGPTLQARAGYTALMTALDGSPLGFGYSYADVAAGQLAALAVLAALWRRQPTGAGATIDFSQLEAVAALVGPLLLERALDGGRSAPAGSASQEGPAAPHGVYPCAGTDRWLALAVFTDDQWQRFGRAIGGPAWVGEARFASLAGRVREAAALDRLVATWTRLQDADAAMVLLQEAGIAAGRVADAADLCDRDPQLAALGHFVTVATPEGRTVRLDTPAFRLSETPLAVATPGPLLGEHTREVLQTLLGVLESTPS